MKTFKSEGFQAASANDCTGLIQIPPQNDAEVDNYEELYPFLPPEASIKGALDKKEIPKDKTRQD